MLNKDAFGLVFNYLPEEALSSFSQVDKASHALVSGQCQQWIAKQSVDHEHLQPCLSDIAAGQSLSSYISSFLPMEWLALLPSWYLENLESLFNAARDEKINLIYLDFERAARDFELLRVCPTNSEALLSFNNFNIDPDIQKLLSITSVASFSDSISPDDIGVSAPILLKEAQFLAQQLQGKSLFDFPPGLKKHALLKIYRHLDATLKLLILFLLINKISSKQQVDLITHPDLNPWINGTCLALLIQHSKDQGLLEQIVNDWVSTKCAAKKDAIEKTLSRMTDYDWQIVLRKKEKKNYHCTVLLQAIEKDCLPIINSIGENTFRQFWSEEIQQDQLMRFQKHMAPEKLLSLLEYLSRELFEQTLERCQTFWTALLNDLIPKRLGSVVRMWCVDYVFLLFNSEVFLNLLNKKEHEKSISASRYLLELITSICLIMGKCIAKQILASNKILSHLMPCHVFDAVQKLPLSGGSVWQNILRRDLISVLRDLSALGRFDVSDWLRWVAIESNDITKVVEKYCHESTALTDFLSIANAVLYDWKFKLFTNQVINRLEACVWQSEENLILALSYSNVARWLAENRVEKLTNEHLKLIQSTYAIGQYTVELLSAVLVEQSKRASLDHHARLAEIKRQHDQRVADIEIEFEETLKTQELSKPDITSHHPEKKSNRSYYVGGVLILLIIFSVFLISVGAAAVFNDQEAINIATKLFGYWGGDAVLNALIVGFAILFGSLGVSYCKFAGCTHQTSPDTKDEGVSSWENSPVESPRPGYLPISEGEIFAKDKTEKLSLQAKQSSDEAINNYSV